MKYNLDLHQEPLAQLVEHLTFNQRVEGSNPSWLTIPAGVAELADALDLGSSVFDVGVRVPSPALELHKTDYLRLV